MQDRIAADLKTAMLAGEALKVETLKGLKSSMMNQVIAQKNELTDDEIIKIIQKEVKKRHEAAELYAKAQDGAQRRDKELLEAEILSVYLPKPLSDAELAATVKKVITGNQIDSVQKMGMAIGLVQKRVGAGVEGAKIAAEVKKQLGV